MHAIIARINAKLSNLNTRITIQEEKIDEKSKSIQVEKKEEKTSILILIAKVELNPRIVGFFDPNYINGTIDSVTIVRKHEIYRDVYIFIDRLYNIANTRPYTYNIVKDVILRYLRNTARIWHSTELIAYERDKLRRSSLDDQYNRLKARFKLNIGVALTNLTSSSYSFQNIRNSQKPRVQI